MVGRHDPMPPQRDEVIAPYQTGGTRFVASAFGRVAFVATALCAAAAPSPSWAAGFSICAVGDSITQGGSSFTAHRVALESVFAANNWSVEWKGTQSNSSWGSSQPCEGYSGNNAAQIAANYVSHAVSVSADVLLLHAGHNYNVDPDTSTPAYMPEEDIVAAATNAHAQIIAAARAQNPDVIVLYAKVITSGKLPKYSYIPALNTAIGDLAAELNTAASPVVAVDMADGWDYATDCVSDMVHPNSTGANKMAAKWFAALEAQVDAGRLTVKPAAISVTKDLVLNSDTDWRGCEVTIASNATLNLNGHVLRVHGLTGDGTVASAREFLLPAGYELLSHVMTPTNNLTMKGYIDTGYKPSGTDRIETKFCTAYVGTKTADIQWVFSSRKTTSQQQFDCVLNPSSLAFPYNATTVTYGAASAGDVFEVVMDGGKGMLEVKRKDAVNTFALASNSFTPYNNLKLFCTADVTSNRNAQGLSMYYFRVFNAAGELKVNMLPALNPSGVAGLYDTVRRTFYPLANGAFVPGAVISHDVLAYVKTPAGNTGTHIDTRYKPSPTDRVETRIMFGDMSANQGIFSSRYTYNNRPFNCMLRNNSKVSFDHINSGSSYAYYHTVGGVQTVYSANKTYDLVMDGNTCEIAVNGVTSETHLGNDMDTTYTNFVLFAAADFSTQSVSSFAKDLRMYSFRVTDTNGCERLNLVPARMRNGGFVGFYDTVRNRFLLPAISATADSAASATDLTQPDGRCCSTIPGNNSTVAANLFNNNFTYKTDSTHRFYLEERMFLPFSIDYDFGEDNAQAVNMYKIYGGFNGRSPTAWALYGSNTDAAFGADGESDWTIIDYVSGEPTWGAASSGKTAPAKAKVFVNDTAYRYYRMKFLEGDARWFDVTQLEYMRAVVGTEPLAAGGTLPQARDLTAPGGTCAYRILGSGGGTSYNSTTAANLFNDNYIYRTDSTSRLSIDRTNKFPVAIDYDFGEGNGQVVNMYRVYGSYGGRCPTAWTLYGSDTAYGSVDETGWTKLDERDGFRNWTGVSSGTAADWHTFHCRNSTSYRYYRFLWRAGETSGSGAVYSDMTQLEYFNAAPSDAPGELHIDVAEGAATTNATVAFGGDMKVVKEGIGSFTAEKAGQFYTGGTDVNAGTFTVAAPLSTMLTTAGGATLGFGVSSGAVGPLLTLESGTSIPSPLNVAVYGGVRPPQDGFLLASGHDFGGVTLNPVELSENVVRVKADGDGDLRAYGRKGFMVIVK